MWGLACSGSGEVRGKGRKGEGGADDKSGGGDMLPNVWRVSSSLIRRGLYVCSYSAELRAIRNSRLGIFAFVMNTYHKSENRLAKQRRFSRVQRCAFP